MHPGVIACHNSVVDKATDSGKAPVERRALLHSVTVHDEIMHNVSAATLFLRYIHPPALDHEGPSVKGVSFWFAWNNCTFYSIKVKNIHGAKILFGNNLFRRSTAEL